MSDKYHKHKSVGLVSRLGGPCTSEVAPAGSTKLAGDYDAGGSDSAKGSSLAGELATGEPCPVCGGFGLRKSKQLCPACGRMPPAGSR